MGDRGREGERGGSPLRGKISDESQCAAHPVHEASIRAGLGDRGREGERGGGGHLRGKIPDEGQCAAHLVHKPFIQSGQGVPADFGEHARGRGNAKHLAHGFRQKVGDRRDFFEQPTLGPVDSVDQALNHHRPESGEFCRQFDAKPGKHALPHSKERPQGRPSEDARRNARDPAVEKGGDPGPYPGKQAGDEGKGSAKGRREQVDELRPSADGQIDEFHDRSQHEPHERAKTLGGIAGDAKRRNQPGNKPEHLLNRFGKPAEGRPEAGLDRVDDGTDGHDEAFPHPGEKRLDGFPIFVDQQGGGGNAGHDEADRGGEHQARQPQEALPDRLERRQQLGRESAAVKIQPKGSEDRAALRRHPGPQRLDFGERHGCARRYTIQYRDAGPQAGHPAARRVVERQRGRPHAPEFYEVQEGQGQERGRIAQAKQREFQRDRARRQFIERAGQDGMRFHEVEKSVQEGFHGVNALAQRG